METGPAKEPEVPDSIAIDRSESPGTSEEHCGCGNCDPKKLYDIVGLKSKYVARKTA